MCRPSLTVPRRPSAQLAPNAVRSWSFHTRVNAQHEPHFTHPAAHRPLPQIPAAERTPPRRSFHRLLSPSTDFWFAHTKGIPGTVLAHSVTSLTPEHAPMCCRSPSISLSLLSTLLLLAPLRGKPHRPARVAPLLSAGPPKNNFNGPLVKTHSLEILFRTQHKAVET